MKEQKKNSLKEWFDSDACKELQKSHQEDVQRAVGKYFMLSENEKLDMVQAILYIICKAEEQGCSHRGLMNELGIYPSGFWCDFLIDTHNALYEYYDKRKQKQELEEDIKTLQNFIENQKES